MAIVAPALMSMRVRTAAANNFALPAARARQPAVVVVAAAAEVALARTA
jgi:hypothetical protein